MDTLQSNDITTPLECNDVMEWIPTIFNSNEAEFLPLEEGDIGSFLQEYRTIKIRKSLGVASGDQRGLKAIRNCLKKKVNLEEAEWMILDINFNPEGDALSEYDSMLVDLQPTLDRGIGFTCNFRKDCEAENTVEVTIIWGVKKSFLETMADRLNLIRIGDDKQGDISDICKKLFPRQLEQGENPFQGQVETFIDATDEQQDVLQKLFDSDLLSVLNDRAKNGCVDAMVLLGQYYYGGSKGDLVFKLEITEQVNSYISETFDISGLPCNKDEVARKRIAKSHSVASKYFLDAYELKSILSMYYLAKLWQERVQKKLKPSVILARYDELQSKVDACEPDNATLLVKLGIHGVIQSEQNEALQEVNRNLQASEAKEKLLNQKMEAHSQQLAKILSMISHNLTPQIDMLWSVIERPDHNQVFRESISNMSLLLDIAKKASSDPVVIRNAMLKESIGNEPLDRLFEASMRTSVIHLLSERNIIAISQHYFAFAVNQEMIPAETSMLSWQKGFGQLKLEIQREWYNSFQDTPYDQMNEWYKKHLGGLVVNINKSSLKLIKYGARYGVLQSILLELFGNAVKYGGTSIVDSVKLTVTTEDDCYIFVCENSIDSNLAITGKGSGRGHDFINLILENIGQDRLKVVKSDDKYSVSFVMSKKLLGG